MKRIQIHLTDKKLDDVVQEMAEAVVRDFKSNTTRSADQVTAIKASIRTVLEKYVHAYDLCGLSTYCREATEVDAWNLNPQDED